MKRKKRKNIDNNRNELTGAEAAIYINENLKQARIDYEKWETEYIDEKTGERWIKDYPHSELHGGGPPRLRKVDKADTKEEE